jgi:predicted ester cyclase
LCRPEAETRSGKEEEAAVLEAEEKNKAVVRRFLEAEDGGDLETLDELLAPDFVDHNLLPDQDPGREGYIQAVAKERDIFSNVHHNIEDQAAEGDKVISRLTISRLHDRGEFLGVAPTGMEFKSSAILIHRVVGGKIVEEWSESRGVLEATRQRLEQERIKRERAEQERDAPAGQ